MLEHNIIQVNQIQVIEKDVIEVKNRKDFEEIYKTYFNGSKILKLQNKYYLIGTDAMYIWIE